uniref:CCHC-type domain-containing protein n=1 Tax=Cajanus cajan TaxID=3821 RepID=A0A151UF29_CAJCA
MTSGELLGKLREYKMDMTRMAEEEQKDKKIKGVALKLENSSSEEEDNSNEDKSEQEELNLMVRKFWKFMKRKNSKRNFSKQKRFFRKFECGKAGHMKADCPNLKKQGQEKKKPKFKSTKKKAYISWEENDSTTSSETDSEEKANLCLMANHKTEY